MAVPPSVAAALTQHNAWKAYQHRFRGDYGRNPLGAKRLGQFVTRYRRLTQKIARHRARGQGPRAYGDPYYLDATLPVNNGPGYMSSDAGILGRGRYRLRGRGKYALKGRGKSQLKKMPIHGHGVFYAGGSGIRSRPQPMLMGSGRYRLRGRGKYALKGRGKYSTRKFASDLGHVSSGLSNFGRRLTTRQQRQRGGTIALDYAQEQTDPGWQYREDGMTLMGQGSYWSPALGANTNQLFAGSKAPVMSFGSLNDEHSDLIVSHSEFLRKVYANPTGVEKVTTSLNINPGLEATFPWLSQIAQNFEKYQIVQLAFRFTSDLSDVISNNLGQVGTIMAAPQYDPGEKTFQTEQQLLTANHKTVGKTTENMMSFVECDNRHLGKPNAWLGNVRDKPIGVGEDPSDFDHAKWIMSVVGTPDGIANQPIGRLEVTYTVLLKRPRDYTKLGFGIHSDKFMSAGTLSVQDPLGNGYNQLAGRPLIANTNNIGCRVDAIQAEAEAAAPTLGPYEEWRTSSAGLPETAIAALPDIDTTLVSEANNSGGTATAQGCYLRIVFPGHVVGNFEITVYSECTEQADANDKFDSTLAGIFVCGNVCPIFDMINGGATNSAASSFMQHSHLYNVGVVAGLNMAENVQTCRVHVHVEIPTKDKDNAVYIPWASAMENGSAVAWTRTSIEVSGYATDRTYKPPAFINSQGVTQTVGAEIVPAQLLDNAIDTNPVFGSLGHTMHSLV